MAAMPMMRLGTPPRRGRSRLLCWWCCLCFTAMTITLPRALAELSEALASARLVVDALGPLSGWGDCEAGRGGDACRASATVELVAASVAGSEISVSWCHTTCGNASASGAGAFDCSGAGRNEQLQLVDNPETVSCGAGLCTPDECCTAAPPAPPRPCVEWTGNEFGAIADVPGTFEPAAGSSRSPYAVEVGEAIAYGAGRFCPAPGSPTPFYHMPSVDDLPPTTAAPALVAVPIDAVVLDDTGIATAVAEIAQALASPPPPANADAPPPPPPVKVGSEITIPVAAEDVSSLVQEGSPQRVEFELGFKTAMSRSLGAGSVVAPDDIIIDAIVAGSVAVAFHIVVPAVVTQAAADLFETLAAQAEPIEIETGEGTIAVSPSVSMSPPTVFTMPAQDCRGVWLQCSANCTRTYRIHQIQAGAPCAL